MPTKIQIRRDSAANWSSANPILSDGEMGFERDTKQFKVGNGVDTWNVLEYTVSESGGGEDLFIDGGLSNSTYSGEDLVIDAGDSN